MFVHEIMSMMHKMGINRTAIKIVLRPSIFKLRQHSPDFFKSLGYIFHSSTLSWFEFLKAFVFPVNPCCCPSEDTEHKSDECHAVILDSINSHRTFDSPQ